MVLQKKFAILRFCAGLGLCCVKLDYGIASGTSFYWLSQGCPRNIFQDLFSLNNPIVQCHTKLTQFPAELVRLSEAGNKNVHVYACVHLTQSCKSFKVNVST